MRVKRKVVSPPRRNLKVVLYTPVICGLKKKWKVGREWGFAPAHLPFILLSAVEKGNLIMGCGGASSCW